MTPRWAVLNLKKSRYVIDSGTKSDFLKSTLPHLSRNGKAFLGERRFGSKGFLGTS